MNTKLIIALVFITAFYTSNGVDVTEVYNFDCRSVIGDNELSPITKIYWEQKSKFDGTCENWDFGEGSLTFNAYFRDGSVAPITRGNRTGTSYNTKDYYNVVTTGSISGACNGATFGVFCPYFVGDLNKCKEGKLVLRETYCKDGYITIIGGGCGFNMCKGYAWQTFPGGIKN